MIEALVRFSIRQRLFVTGGVLTLVGIGLWAYRTLPFEAFPDLTANSVSILAEAPGLAPQDVEQLVTFPIERSLLGLPRTEAVRSATKFGLAIVQVVFEDRVDPYFARQLVAERLSEVASALPEGATAVMGPVATAMGEVYQYVLVNRNPDLGLTELKTLQDFGIAPQLRVVQGVAEVNSWGGFTEQIHVVADPARLSGAGLSLLDLEAALAENNRAFGGTYVEARSERHVVRGEGRITGIEEIRSIPAAVRDGVPILVGDLASVEQGALPRQGAVTHNGLGEVVSGMVIMRKGENAQRVIAAVEARMEEIQRTLPPGVEVLAFYDQGRLVEQTTHTIQKNLLLGGTLVIILLWGFLRNIAASILVAVVIPLSMLWAFTAMRWWGFSANLMSLGALDFGLLVDGSVVMVENIMRRAGEEHEDEGPPAEAEKRAVARLTASALEVARPVVFGIAIIMVVYLPIFALQGTERRMFVPMAFTVVAALLGSLVLALTFIPAASRTFLLRAREVHTPGFDRFRDQYRSFLAGTMERPGRLALAAAAAVVVSLASVPRLGSEFMPRLDEGSVLVQALRLPSTSLDQGVAFSSEIERALVGLPEVVEVVSKLGRPDLATEAMGTYESDTYVILTDRKEWRRGGKDALLAAMDSALSTVPGIEYAFTQPIQMRLDEAESGITTDVGVRIFGSDPDRLAELADRVEAVLARVPGAAEVRVSAAARMSELRVIPDRQALARTGLSVAGLGHQVETALGANVATELVDGPRRVEVVVRVPGGNARDPRAMADLPIGLPSGGLAPLGSLATLVRTDAPEAFAHEGGRRMVVVGANVRGRDVGSFVAEAGERLEAAVPLPEGYALEWGGQFTHQRTAMRRLAILGPLSILGIFLLLFSAFGKIRQAVLILLNVPFALVGGIAALWLGGLNLSTSALIGFIAVFGIAVLNGVVMVSYMNQLRARGLRLREAVLDGAATRLRPVLMTALAASFGFIPMALSRSPGAELQRPLATVVIGGILTATFLTLLVLPSLYHRMEERLGGA